MSEQHSHTWKNYTYDNGTMIYRIGELKAQFCEECGLNRLGEKLIFNKLKEKIK